MSCHTTILTTSDDHQHVLLRAGGRNLQLCATGADITEPVRLRVDAIWHATSAKHRLMALDCLNALHAKGRFPAGLFPADARGNRLRFVLRALDGSLDGAPHRDIAIALLGWERIQDDWADPGNHLRDRIRRAVVRGRALMKGGYREFLL
ncbi:DNA -binding domain-containing protein [Chelativorans sp. M5D2P16]|uniref:DNA -binding domain-containing protein n=1 Tax=Chelativorans sp. M5D2P16 TaxID=3095678 RepID=UPI002ACA16B9|nr:DUF2285 domain-containing protein [Chelativorans sp. M5D2P16]MDZ5696741.1 DUF2285 domain-containing protein [Chelativorans sp. M5D2P16]